MKGGVRRWGLVEDLRRVELGTGDGRRIYEKRSWDWGTSGGCMKGGVKNWEMTILSMIIRLH